MERLTQLRHRKRDAEATRDALLTAAKAEFHTYGYECASTRRIAADAGCNVALINRYFDSKKGLFQAVMGACIDLSPLIGLSREEMVSTFVDIAFQKAEEESDFDPMVVAIRSSGSDPAQEIIKSELGDPMAEDLAAIIGGKKARQKAVVILSIIAGVYVGRVSIGEEAMSREQEDIVRPYLSTAIRAVLSSDDEEAA